MDELFGLEMSVLLAIVLVSLGIILAVTTTIAVRRPLLFKMGLRNLPRRRAQTSLIIVGLMLSTLIVATAFTTGDTLASSLRNTAFEITGPIDHLVQFEAPAGGTVQDEDAVVPQAVIDDLEASFGARRDPDIRTFVRVIFDDVSVANVTRSQQEPTLFLLGLDPAEVDAIGGIPRLDGGGDISLAELGASKIILNESAAKSLGAEIGDVLNVRARGEDHAFEVFAIAEDTLLSGKVDIAQPEGAVIHLEDAQAIFNQPEQVTGVGVTVRGGLEGALEFSAAVDQRLNEFLVNSARREIANDVPLAERVYSDGQGRALFASWDFKSDTVDDAETFGSIFTTFFLVMGSFSIAAGVLLIFLIFAMLAEERKTEMGIARAVGMQQGQLLQLFLAEGLAYNLGAAVIGTITGIFLAFGMVEVLNFAFDEFGLSFTQHVEPRSVVVAASIGIIVTFVTVLISAFRVSQLNIVAAIRDVPESGTAHRSRIALSGLLTTPLGLVLMPLTPVTAPLGFVLLAMPRVGEALRRRDKTTTAVLPFWRLMRRRQEWWFVLLLLGAYALLGGLDGESLPLYMFGLSTIPLGLVLFARRINRAGRAVYTIASATVLFFWFAPYGWHQTVWGVALEGNIEMFILSGVMMVTAGTLLLTFNLPVLVGGIRAIGWVFGRLQPVVQTAVAYPTTARYRTGMTMAMIAIISFALITFTTINSNFQRAFTSDAARGGFDVQADTDRDDAIESLTAALQHEPSVLAMLDGVGTLRIGSSRGTDVQTLTTERWDAVDDAVELGADGDPVVDRLSEAGDPFAQRNVFFAGADPRFTSVNAISFQARARGFDFDTDVWRAVAEGTEPVAVVTASAISGGGGPFGLDDEAWEIPGDVNESTRNLPRVSVLVRNGDRTQEFTVIAVIDQVVSVTELPVPEFAMMIVAERFFTKLYDDADFTRHLAVAARGTDSLEAAQAVEAALRIETVSITNELEERQGTSNAILALFQGFTGLGLLAGLAAVGVIAVRAVVERRQHIGVLRAIGFQRRHVGLALLLEMGFIALLGITLGVTLSIALAWRLFSEDVFGSTGGLDFYVPIGRILLLAFGSLAAALILTYLPARQAARTTIAEALRYE